MCYLRIKILILNAVDFLQQVAEAIHKEFLLQRLQYIGTV